MLSYAHVYCFFLDLNQTIICELSDVTNNAGNVIILAECVGAFEGKRRLSTIPSTRMIERIYFYNNDATLFFHHNLFQQKHE